MEFTYKCPVCRANNRLTVDNLHCRRCQSDLSSIYRIKKQKVFEVMKASLYCSAEPLSQYIDKLTRLKRLR